MHRLNLYRVGDRNPGFADRSDRRLHVRPALLAVEETLDLLGLVVLLLADGLIEALEGGIEGFHERSERADGAAGQARDRFSGRANSQ